MTNSTLVTEYIEMKKELGQEEANWTSKNEWKIIILEAFIELIEKSSFGEKAAETIMNFSALDRGGLCGLFFHRSFVADLAKKLFSSGYFSVEMYQDWIDEKSYFRFGHLQFDPDRQGISVIIPPK